MLTLAMPISVLLRPLRSLLLLAVLCGMSGAGARAAETLPFATGDQPPYTSSAMPGQGATTRLIAAICAAAGLSPTFDFYPWKRAEMMVASGQAFAAFPYARTAEREAVFDFSEPLYRVNNAVVFNVRNPRTPGAVPFARDADLKPYLVGIIRGSFAEPRLRAAGVRIQFVDSVEQALAMLLVGRIDLYVDDTATILHVAREKFPDQAAQIQPLPQPFDDGRPNYLMVSRNYPEAEALLRQFNRAMAKLRKSGEYARLIAQFGLPP